MSDEKLDEVLDVAQRRKMGMRMKRLAPRIKRARERALKRTATPDKIKKRADKMARNQLFQKLSQTSRGDASVAKKREVEKRMSKMQPKIKALSKRMIRKVRTIEKERRANRNKTEK
jgi:hypothetical protein